MHRQSVPGHLSALGEWPGGEANPAASKLLLYLKFVLLHFQRISEKISAVHAGTSNIATEIRGRVGVSLSVSHHP